MCIFKKMHCLTFDYDFGVKITRNVAQCPLHLVTYELAKVEVATCKCFGGDAFRRNVTESCTHKCTDARIDGQIDERWTNFCTKLIYPF